MNKDKQIMSQILKDYTKKKHIMASCAILDDYAEELYNAGYRKASDVAREIFEEIEKYLISSDILPDCCRLADMNKIAELKKKYTEEKHNGTDN